MAEVTYVLSAPGGATMWTEVEVEELNEDGTRRSPQELLDAVLTEGNIEEPTLCHQCSGGSSAWSKTSLELDEWDYEKATLRKKGDKDDD